MWLYTGANLIWTLPSPFSNTLVFNSLGPVPVARKGASPMEEVRRLPNRSKRQVARLPGWAAGTDAGRLGSSHLDHQSYIRSIYFDMSGTSYHLPRLTA